MPNDLVSREAAVASIKAKAEEHSKNSAGYSGGVYDGMWCAIGLVANLPAAGDERWEKEMLSLIDDYRTSLKQGGLESDTGEDMLHYVIEDLERIRNRLSPPQQEAGDNA